MLIVVKVWFFCSFVICSCFDCCVSATLLYMLAMLLVTLNIVSQVESLIGGLAAVQLLCSSCPEDTRAFIDGGGMRLLHQVVKEVSGTTALLLFALTSVECLIRHGYACEAFSDEGKKILLTLLDGKQRPPVKDLLHQILQRLECYELSVRFGVMLIMNTVTFYLN